MKYGLVKEVLEVLSVEDEGVISRFLETLDWDTLNAGRTELSPTVAVVKIEEKQPIGLAHLLEYHRSFADLHVTLEGNDSYRFKLLADCTQESKPYDPDQDYGLYEDAPGQTLVVHPGEAVYIGTDMAHMALCGAGQVRKLVFKIRLSA